MIYTVKINDKEYEVEVERGKANIVKTSHIPAQSNPLPAATPAPAVAPSSQVISSGSQGIKSPMPGTILDIKVAEGQHVKKGEILLILEAMKMENEIMAPVDGVVAQVYVVKGASVATDDMLISIQQG